MNHYDYIICGAGCAGLSLAYRLTDERFRHLKILLLDKESKDKNDRTWSFWSDKPHLFDDIVIKQWNHINFYGNQSLQSLDIQPYSYQTIKGIDFYTYTLESIEKCDHIDVKYEAIQDIRESKSNLVEVETNCYTYTCQTAFNSIVKSYPSDDFHFVWQHFKGWIIESHTSFFDDTTATFMDFRINQAGETRFVYVLPYSPTTALVEATIFSKNRWDPTEYDPILKKYISDILQLSDYKVLEEEHGAIPMTTSQFHKDQNRQIIPIGTLNDSVKPSSGYAFIRIQEEAEEIAKKIKTTRDFKNRKRDRFTWYDRTLLDVIIRKKESAKDIFSLMFEKNKPQKIFQFLNEKTTVLAEANIFITLPFWSFLSSFISSNVLKKTKAE